MRLIDADALIERIKYSFYSHERVRIDTVTGTFLTEFCSDTIEAEPVTHGKWIKTTRENGCAEWTEFECSVCGAVFDGNEWLFDKWKGCPVCLSRLDGGADNG